MQREPQTAEATDAKVVALAEQLSTLTDAPTILDVARRSHLFGQALAR